MRTTLSTALTSELRMQLETRHPICSLCKREIDAFSVEAAPGTKLCESCRGLIQTAFHSSDSRTVASSASDQTVAYAQPDASAADQPAFFEDDSFVCGTFEHEQENALFDADDQSSFVSFAEHARDEVYSAEPNLLDGPAGGFSEQRDELQSVQSNGSAESKPDELDLARVDESHSDEQLVAHAVPAFDPVTTDEPLQAESEDVHSTQSESPADPWEEPLPAWDFSRSEWPVLVGPPRGRSIAKFKVPIALLALLAGAAGFYYLIYPQLSRERTLSTGAVSSERKSVEPRSAEPKPSDVAQKEPLPASVDAHASTDARSSQRAESDVSPRETGNGQWRFALQAAAFPTQAGADEFALKLKTAGVPSYVVGADLKGRGKWFRVRVGRFGSAEDAQRFAAEAQTRAKAAGISLQLMVSPYEQP